MKLFISRAGYDRATAGMSETEIGQFDAVFERYPDQHATEPFLVDQERIATRYASLLGAGGREPKQPAAAVTPQEYCEERIDQWSNAWTKFCEWMKAEDLLTEQEPDDSARRYYLNNITVDTGWAQAAAAPFTVEQLNDVIRRWSSAPWARPRVIKAGEAACARFAAMATKPSWPKDMPGSVGSLARLTGIPILPDPDMAPGAWKLIDRESGDVLYEGTVDTER